MCEPSTSHTSIRSLGDLTNGNFSLLERYILEHIVHNYTTCRCKRCHTFNTLKNSEDELDENYMRNLENRMAFDRTSNKISNRGSGAITGVISHEKYCVPNICRLCNPVDLLMKWVEQYRAEKEAWERHEAKKQRIIQKSGRAGYFVYRVGDVLKHWY